MKKLYRSKNNQVIGGVLGGVGEYLNIDPVVVRIVYLVVLALTHVFPLVIIYGLMLIVVPLKPDTVIEGKS